jgi:putative Holliday junction resolvase
MEAIIAFDIGDKRIGVAFADALLQIPMPVETYYRKGTTKDVVYLAELATRRGANRIVCGMPVNFDGSESVQTVKTQRFIEKLKEVTDLPISLVDERFTTLSAHHVLIEGDMRREQRKEVVDKIAASYILENYLNSK